jgi:mycothiol synthase
MSTTHTIEQAQHTSGALPKTRIRVPEAPTLPSLTFRGFRGEEDYPAMVAVIEGSKEADQLERTSSVQDVARSYQYLTNCDPYRDMLFAEVKGQVVGYSRVWWQEELDGTRVYEHFCYLLPQWRGKGVRRAMLRHNERRLRQLAAEHQAVFSATDGNGPARFFQAWGADTETDWLSLLSDAGYKAVRYSFEMVRPDLEELPDLPLPEGLEVRRARPVQYRTIWQANQEAFKDHWGAIEWHDEWFEEWKVSPTFQPELWQVAWQGEEVAGMVLNYIDAKENEAYERRRGYTEDICVRRPWRRRGLARSLIARSLRLLKAQGMNEAALGVDADNPHGALRLYQSMGFRTIKQYTILRKRLEPVAQA